jgi:putative ABC transport system permease protein
MKITAKLAYTQLKENRSRTLLTLLGIIISVAMITAVFGFAVSGRNAIHQLFLSKGDYHIAYQGIPAKDADILMASPEISKYYTQTDDAGNITLYCRLSNPTSNAYNQMMEIAVSYGITYNNAFVNTELLAIEGHEPDRYTTVIYSVASVLFLVIMGASIVVISNAFRVSAGERTKQFGMLKSVGATSRQIRSTVIHEGLILAIGGIPLGISIGLLVEAIGCQLAGYFLTGLNTINRNPIHMKFTAPLWVIVLAALLAFVTIFLSAYLPAAKAARLSAIEAIRGNREVAFRAKKIRSSKLIRLLFSVEGELAAKAMKRSRRSYRATVITLSASVVLFLVSITFGQSMMVDIDMVYPDVEASVITAMEASSGYGEGADSDQIILPLRINLQKAEEITNRLASYDSTTSMKMVGSGFSYLEQHTTDDIWSKDGKKYLPQGAAGEPVSVTFIILDDAYYQELCEEAKVPLGSNILLNQVLMNAEGKRALFSPYKENVENISLSYYDVSGREVIPAEETLPLQTMEIPIAGQLTDLSGDLRGDGNHIYIVTPDGEMDSITWLIDVEDSRGFSAFARDVLREMLIPPKGSNLTLNSLDLKSVIDASRGINNLFMVFIYGFIAMLTLIGLTNVISTISTNIRLRKREFAVLVSLGMTPEGIKRMISYESLLCGLRSLFFGLIIGLGLSYFNYTTMTDIINFPYEFPVIPVIASIAAVLLLTFATMRFSAARVRRGNVMDAIRESE